MKPGLIPFCISVITILVVCIIGLNIRSTPTRGDFDLGPLAGMVIIGGCGACIIVINSLVGVFRGIFTLRRGTSSLGVIVLLTLNSLLLLFCVGPVVYHLCKIQTDINQAVFEKNVSKVKTLLFLGANVNKRRPDGCTPLRTAVLSGNYEMSKILLDHGANPNATDDRDLTPLHMLCAVEMDPVTYFPWEGWKVAELLIAYGAEVNLIAPRSTGGRDVAWTPLQIASDRGKIKMVEFLLRHGADVNILADDNYNALRLAAKRGHIDIAKLLMQHGASLNSNPYPLFDAVEEQSRVMVQFMLEMGANPNVSSEETTPLHCAACGEDPRILEDLLHYGADPNARNYAAETPLHCAARNNRWKNIGILLKYYLDVDIPSSDEDKQTPLYCALLSCKPGDDQKKTMAILLMHGANPRKGSRDKSTIRRVMKWDVYNEVRISHQKEILEMLKLAAKWGPDEPEDAVEDKPLKNRNRRGTGKGSI